MHNLMEMDCRNECSDITSQLLMVNLEKMPLKDHNKHRSKHRNQDRP